MEKIANDISGRVRPTTGPCSGLLSRLHQINWSWRDSTIKDHWGREIDVETWHGLATTNTGRSVLKDDFSTNI